jgi:hypothetical protein
MTRQRLTTDTMGERVVSLEAESASHTKAIDDHEERLDDHDKWLNQVRGSVRTMAVLWAIAVALNGFGFVRDYLSRPVSAASAKP